MTHHPFRLLYVSPVFLPAIGGGVIYLDILSRYLLGAGICADVHILTERHPRAPGLETDLEGRRTILRRFPFRAGRNTRNAFSYLLYAAQNLQFLALPLTTKRLRPDIVVVHGSFLNNPSSIWSALRALRSTSPQVRLVADLRDPKLPPHRIPDLRLFDLVISCSRNITERLGGEPEVLAMTREIPIMLEPPATAIQGMKKRLGLGDRPYVFNGSGINQEKGIDRLIALVEEIRRTRAGVQLVVAGKRRHESDALRKAEQEGWLRYVGQLPHEDALTLSAEAWLDANLSSVDSMPRHSLEALMAGARVLLPPGVPEFTETCPDFIAGDDSIEALAQRAIRIAEGGFGPCPYPLDRHTPEHVIQQYADAFEELRTA